jgi:PAS domain S-box-containing protein
MNSCGSCANDTLRTTRRLRHRSDVEVEMEKTADEVKRLQSCINDLISVLALAAIWSGSESCQMVGTLLESLLAILRLDFACARLNDSIDGSPIEVVRLAQRQHTSAQQQEVGRALGRWLSGDKTASRFVIPNPAGEGEVAIASFSLGLQDEVGVLVAGSRRADFPTDIELVLLRVAANQAAIGLQEARRSGDQKRVAESLERRVAERTRQLTTVNEELRRSQAYLAEAQRLSHTGSFGWRVSTGEILWSEETFRIFQYDRASKPSVELVLQRIHPEDAASVKDTVERAPQDGKDFGLERRLLMPDGSVKHVHIVAHAERDESGALEFVGAVMDISERKRAEEALRRSEAYLAEAQRLTGTGSWAWNVATRQSVYWSQENYRLFGFDPEAGIPSDESFYQRIHAEDRDRVLREVFLERPEEGCDFDVEFRFVLPEGAIKYVRSTGHPVRNISGDLLEYVGTSIDVTERRRADEERERLRQALAELAHINRVTTMGELAASLAHEVNQPIAAASTNANTCLRWLAGDIPNIEEARAAAMRIVKDGKRAAEIIKRIRLLFKKGTPEREPVDVNEVVREMTVLLGGETTRYNILVGTDLAPDLPQVMADRVQLQQVLMNLMLNGIDAMKDVDGTRELTIKSQRLENEQLMVLVSDTGAGLPVQQADQIFTAFFTTKPHGTGMGLSISRSIIESHGGHLRGGDNSPRGALFYFTLPSKDEAHE